MEIERKFLVNHLPDLNLAQYQNIIQGYVSFDPEVRIRKVGIDKFYLTKKTNGDLVREEIETPISEINFECLISEIKGRLIYKTRYKVPLIDGHTAELDIYMADMDGLITVEVEFKDEETANNFEIPDWFGQEITYDKRYKNKNIARCDHELIKDLINSSPIKKLTINSI